MILQGDALKKLKELSANSINMCITSPPYWALRDYGVDGQFGLETTFEEYINKLCDIFDEVKRVTKDTGTCWVNLGDTYMGNSSYCENGKQGYSGKDGMMNKWKNLKNSASLRARDHIKQVLKPKTLTMIPFRFAIEMVNRGWILRNTIIWKKNNCMPSSVKDRFTVDFEYLFFFSKNQNYFFKQQFENKKIISIEHFNRAVFKTHKNLCIPGQTVQGMHKARSKGQGKNLFNPEGRNKRCVWSINTKPFKEAHFAVYPEELIEIPIKAGCPEDGTVLDPFFGSGTTAVVAIKQKKKYIGIELNPKYIEIAKKRIYEVQTGITIKEQKKGQKGLF